MEKVITDIILFAATVIFPTLPIWNIPTAPVYSTKYYTNTYAQYDITLLTMQDYLSAEPGDTFTEDIILDDRLLTEA